MMLRMNSWAKVSVIGILAAAGTVLGTSAIAAAQTAPVEVRKQVKVLKGDDGQIQVRVENGDDDDDAPRAERRIVVREQHAGGGKAKASSNSCCGAGCSCCSGQHEDGDREEEERDEPSRFGPHAQGHQLKLRIAGPQGAEGGQGGQWFSQFFGPGQGSGGGWSSQGGRTIVLGQAGGDGDDGEGHAKTLRIYPGGGGAMGFGFGGGQGGGLGGGVEAHVSGKVIIVGPDGQTRTYSFGDEGSTPRVRARRGPDGEAAPRPPAPPAPPAPPGAHERHELRLRTPDGGSGIVSAPVRGHIVIVGPDGREQAFEFGGENPGLQTRWFAAPQFKEFRDGAGPGGHLWKMQGGDGHGRQQEREQRFELRGGGSVM